MSSLMLSPALDSAVSNAAQQILAYLAATESRLTPASLLASTPHLASTATLSAALSPTLPAPADAVIGFGVFDLRLPRLCGELFTAGAARVIVFTGGLGAGTGTLGGPEADVWRAELRRSYPQIHDSAVIVENRSTNTAENIRFTAELLQRDYPALALGTGIRSALIVTSPSRLRRARLTLAKLQPAVRVSARLPSFSFETEHALYAANGVDYLAHLAGEVDRIVDYAARGWIVAEPLPAAIIAARAALPRS